MKIAIAVACVLAVILGVFVVVQIGKNSYVDGPGMENEVSILSIDYYRGGDEYGRSTSISLSNGQVKYSKDEGTVGGSVELSCATNDDLVLALEGIMRTYSVKSWVDLPSSDIEVLDGATTSMTIKFADGTTVRLGDGYEMPEGGWAAVKEIRAALEACVTENSAAAEASVEITPADDSNLTLLVDYCKKTVATVGGDSYSEIVLYKNDTDSTYQLHTYSKSAGASQETHRAYTAFQSTADAAFDLIDQLKLADFKDAKGTGQTGAEHVVRFAQGDQIIRISTDNLGADGASMLSSVGDLLYSALPE